MAEPQETSHSNETPKPGTSKAPGIAAVILSTFAAAFGVQNDKNRERDFEHGNIHTFIISGVLFTAFLVVAVILLTKFVLS